MQLLSIVLTVFLIWWVWREVKLKIRSETAGIFVDFDLLYYKKGFEELLDSNFAKAKLIPFLTNYLGGQKVINDKVEKLKNGKWKGEKFNIHQIYQMYWCEILGDIINEAINKIGGRSLYFGIFNLGSEEPYVWSSLHNRLYRESRGKEMEFSLPIVGSYLDENALFLKGKWVLDMENANRVYTVYLYLSDRHKSKETENIFILMRLPPTFLSSYRYDWILKLMKQKGYEKMLAKYGLTEEKRRNDFFPSKNEFGEYEPSVGYDYGLELYNKYMRATIT